MQDALVHYRHQIDQNLSRNARSPRRSLIRSIFYYLHSSRVKATDLQIPISDKRLKKVESFIQQFRRDFLGDCPMRDKALFFSALGDLFTRKGEYEEGLYLSVVVAVVVVVVFFVHHNLKFCTGLENVRNTTVLNDT